MVKEDNLKCEECGQEITEWWGIEVPKANIRYHYFCSEEHGNTWARRQPYKLITSMVIDGKTGTFI